jgi:hypothetical protein
LTYRTEQGVEFQLKLAANPPAFGYSFDKLLSADPLSPPTVENRMNISVYFPTSPKILAVV